jgi:oligopeptide transport system ATP-binding protein
MDLFHKEFHDYLNMLTRIKLADKLLKNKIFEINRDPELNRQECKEQLRAARVKHVLTVKEFKAQLPGLKKKYLEVKSQSRLQIKKEVAVVKAEKRRVFKALMSEWADKRATMKTFQKGSAAHLKAVDELGQLRVKIFNNSETFRRRFKVTKKEAYEKAIQIMNEVGINDPEKRFNQYPFQFSGGMRQRIVIAIALTANPELLICDEPTTALDVTIQKQILNLIKDIKKQRDLSVIFITHDLGVVANMADRVAVMYAGKIVEYGSLNEIFYEPKHPYTWALLSSAPDLETKDKLLSIPGTPPDMLFPPKGDAFADRNQFALKIDFDEQPPYFKISDTHYAATWLLHPFAPKIEMPKILQERVARYHETEKKWAVEGAGEKPKKSDTTGDSK